MAALDGRAARYYNPSKLVDDPQYLEYQLKNLDHHVQKGSKANSSGE
jgi:hypothetical protein